MTPLIQRLIELAGLQVASQIEMEFGGQSVFIPCSAREIAIVSEFDGANHAELALRYGVSLQRVYHLLKRARLQALAGVLPASAESSPSEVLWASPVTQLGHPGVLAAALQAIEKATAQGHLDQLVIALAFQPSAPAAMPQAVGQPVPPTAPAESQPGTPGRADSPPTR